MAKKRKSETAPAASPLVRTGSGLADTGPRQSGMAPTSRPYYESKFALNELPTEMPTDGMLQCRNRGDGATDRSAPSTWRGVSWYGEPLESVSISSVTG